MTKPNLRGGTVAAALLTTHAFVGSALAAADRSWEHRGPSGALGCQTVVVAPSSSQVLYAGCAALLSTGDVYRSTDRGMSWTRLVDGPSDVPIDALAVDPANPNRLYAGSSDGGGVYVSSDGGESWTTSTNGLPGFALVRLLLTHPSTPSVVYAVSYSGFDREGGLFWSEDGGSTWHAVGGGVDIIQALAIDPRTGVLYAGTRGEPAEPPITDPGGLYESRDLGASWRRLDLDVEDPGFNAQSTIAIALRPFAPGAPPTLYVATESNGVLRSRDGGDTWQRIDNGMPAGTSVLLTDPVRPETVYAGGAGGVFRSRNEGATWEPLSTDLAGLPVNTLGGRAEVSGEETVLYAATNGGIQPVYRRPTPDDTDILLTGGRFRVSLTWQDFESRTGRGHAVRLSDDSANFWFFGPANTEVTVKVLDGRAINGAFWVFYGSLSNVEFTLTVTDVVEESTRIYENPLGTFASFGDTSAFPE